MDRFARGYPKYPELVEPGDQATYAPLSAALQTRFAWDAHFAAYSLPEISRRYQMNSDTFVEPRFAVGGFWALDDLAHTPSAHGAMTDVRLKAEAGVSLGVKEGASLSAVGGVEQGAEAAENVWSGQLQLKVPLNK